MKLNNGYLVVASYKEFFYKSAINLIENIKEYDENAKVCLVTEERFLDGQEWLADDLIFCDDHKRAKLLGMAKSPYDVTFYIDADCEVVHEDIANVWDELNDNDLVFTCLPDDRSYCFAEHGFPGGKLWLCGAVCLYDMRKQIVKDFVSDWYDLTVRQYSGEWWPVTEDGTPDLYNYPKTLKRWDQFSLWWLVNKEPKYENLKVGIFDDDSRWNYYSSYREGHNTKPIVIRHYSALKSSVESNL